MKGDGLSVARERMLLIVARVERIGIRDYETADMGRLVDELLPQSIAVLADAVTLVEELVAQGEEDDDVNVQFMDDPSPDLGSPYVQFEHALDAALSASSARSKRAASDIGFIALLELRQRRERLARLGASHGAFAIIGECDSTLRRIRKALSAIDVALAQAEGRAAALGFESELDVSLRVRRCYARFRRRILTEDEARREDVHARLRRVGTELAILVGKNEYPDFRVRDRLQFRALQARVLDWLRSGERRAEDGLRIWKDTAAVVEMLTVVSARQELVAHDTAVLRALAETLSDDAVADSMEAVQRELAPLEGLDPEIDALIMSPKPPAFGECRRVIDRALGQRSRSKRPGVEGG